MFGVARLTDDSGRRGTFRLRRRSSDFLADAVRESGMAHQSEQDALPLRESFAKAHEKGHLLRVAVEAHQPDALRGSGLSGQDVLKVPGVLPSL